MPEVPKTIQTSILAVITVAALGLGAVSDARAFTIGTFISKGCHEAVTADALRIARARLRTAPFITPSKEEQALIDDLPFNTDPDMRDLSGATLLVAVRDNDIKGYNPADQVELVPISGDPILQWEHCLRNPNEDEPDGAAAALADCRAYIHDRAVEALDGLGDDGSPDPAKRTILRVYLQVRGSRIEASLPLYYVRIAQALHSLEDGFTHTLRTDDGMRVTTVLNWTEYVDGKLNEPRDGPPHMLLLDRCDDADEKRARRRKLAITAASELLIDTLDPSLTKVDKIAAIDATLARYFSLEPGCNIGNRWCQTLDDSLRDSNNCSCRLGSTRRAPGAGPIVVLASLLAIALSWRRRSMAGLLVTIMLLSSTAMADPPPDPSSAKSAAPATGDAAPVLPPTPVEGSATTPSPPPETPTAPVAPTPNEPGRDVKTPTRGEIKKVRETKRLGPRLGIYGALAASWDHPAVAVDIAARYRISEKWHLGLDAEWNPAIMLNQGAVRPGFFNLYVTGVRRFPLTWERVNLRIAVHLGISTMLFDVYGAPRGSFGPYVGISPLGVDVDLGKFWRLIIEPVNLEIPVPHLAGVPFYYQQYRFTIGIQFGA